MEEQNTTANQSIILSFFIQQEEPILQVPTPVVQQFPVGMRHRLSTPVSRHSTSSGEGSQSEVEKILKPVSIPLPHIPVGGHLKHFVHKWRKLTSDPVILDMVQGMSLDLTDIPVQKTLPHEIQMNQEEFRFAQDHIKTLLGKGAIIETGCNPETDFLSNVFL